MTSYHTWPNMKVGSKGPDVLRLQQLLAGANRFGYNARPGPVDGVFGVETGNACMRIKWYPLGYQEKNCAPIASETLRTFLCAMQTAGAQKRTVAMGVRAELRRRAGKFSPPSLSDHYPLAKHGSLIGRPYQGTHNHSSPNDPMHNWESCNAVDIAIPWGTGVLAVFDGVIGPGWGPLDSSNPVLAGQRIHLVGHGNEIYYAHCSTLIARPGQQVRQGQVIALSGAANGVLHLHFATKVGDPGKLIGDPSPGYVDQHYPD